MQEDENEIRERRRPGFETPPNISYGARVCHARRVAVTAKFEHIHYHGRPRTRFLLNSFYNLILPW